MALKVLILGSGPAGLMAAHAARMSEHDAIIVSQRRKSHLKGAQYLHSPIPRAGSGEPFLVRYQLDGTAEGYGQKVYGPDYQGTVSPEELGETHEGWDIRTTYDRLWALHGEDKVQHVKADFRHRSEIANVIAWATADIIISTIPAPLLCYQSDKHTFTSQNIWSAEENTVFVPIEDNTVVCNGQKAPAWYRAARIQDVTTVEWPYDNRPPIPSQTLHDVVKPLKTNCNCRGEIHRLGRYGKWRKGVLSHEAFQETLEILSRGEQLALL